MSETATLDSIPIGRDYTGRQILIPTFICAARLCYSVVPWFA